MTEIRKNEKSHHSHHRMHPNSLANLRPNLNGRPKSLFSITSCQKKKLLEICPFDSQGRTWLEALAESGMRQALNIPMAMSNLQDRHEGKISQPIESNVYVSNRAEDFTDAELALIITRRRSRGVAKEKDSEEEVNSLQPIHATDL